MEFDFTRGGMCSKIRNQVFSVCRFIPGEIFDRLTLCCMKFDEIAESAGSALQFHQ